MKPRETSKLKLLFWTFKLSFCEPAVIYISLDWGRLNPL
jgi:hypothetical protein